MNKHFKKEEIKKNKQNNILSYKAVSNWGEFTNAISSQGDCSIAGDCSVPCHTDLEDSNKFPLPNTKCVPFPLFVIVSWGCAFE